MNIFCIKIGKNKKNRKRKIEKEVKTKKIIYNSNIII